eukprot:TRINITY_DN34346_c0_g1_i1.p1 TRINITY_DN34346_c0_g1~~TRINITY_DN34346_c0_g1_i1.p1  ORF type:complete len:259 (+),score=36.36 TRINITY_DN34346_c0_g1_i1:86-778(+)
MQGVSRDCTEGEALVQNHMDAEHSVADPFVKSLQEHMASDVKKKAAWALQIRDLQGPSDGDKLWLLSVADKIHENKMKGRAFRKQSITLNVWYGICAAVVPILIPFSQTYKDQMVTVSRIEICVGTAISVFAVLCSLVGTVLHTVMLASKTNEQATLYGKEAERNGEEMTAFLSQADHYAELDGLARFRVFVQRYNMTRNENSRMNLFTSGNATDVENNGDQTTRTVKVK